MQIIELYIKGYNRLNGTISTTTTNKLVDSSAQFTIFANVGDIANNLTDGTSAIITAIDNDTTLSVSDNIFIEGQDYRIESEYIRVDLFKDESVTITDSVLNIKDIGKIFTPFSQQFTLPASKLNNKLFRHYENSDVVDSFDARYRQDAIIKLNGVDYKTGKIQFKSSQLKNNVAYSYKVIFFGDTVELKELLGEAELTSLSFDPSLNFEYTYENVRDKFINPSDVCFPLITHSKNMRLNNGLYRDSLTNTSLVFTDIKPAIKTKIVLDAITNTYPRLKFSNGFFNSTTFSELYMWLHRKQGFITNAIEGGGLRTVSNRFRHQANFETGNTWIYNSTLSADPDLRTAYFDEEAGIGSFKKEYFFDLQVTSGTSNEYTVFIKRASDNEELNQYTRTTSSLERTVINEDNIDGGFVDIMIEIQSANSLALTQKLTVTEKLQILSSSIAVCVYNPESSFEQTSNNIVISEQMPKMKIIDWLSNLFKMFNLVVYKKGDEMIVDTANYYSSTGLSYDITKYVDMSTSSVERLFQYKNMNFKYKSKKSFLVQFSDEIQGNSFSERSYGDDEWDGGDYKVEVDFEKMMYERLTDETTAALSTIGQGAMLDKDFNPTIGKPLLFYIKTTNANGAFTIQNSDGSEALQVDNYNRPTQLTFFSIGNNIDDRMSLNFGVEADEFLQEVAGDGYNLFQNYYLDYVNTVFDRRSRLLKCSAYLPLSLITQYNMNDTFVINNKPYRINSIKTNLLTNKTDLELYNKNEFVSQIENGQVAYLGRLASLTKNAVTSTTLDIGWTVLTESNITGYSVYIDGAFYITQGPSKINVLIINLIPKTTYTITVRVKYLLNGNVLYSNDTLIQATTLSEPLILAENNDTLITEDNQNIILE